MGISLAKAELLSLALTTFLYGLFFTLFCITVTFMSFRVTCSVRQQRVKILLASFLLLLVATLHLVIIWIRAVQGFVVQKRGSAEAFYADLSDPTSVARVICLCIQTIPADLVIIWRLYVVYGKRLLVAAVPLLLVTGYTAVGFVAVWYITRADAGTDIFHVAKAWITAYFSLTVSTNVICSGAIALRIFLLSRRLPSGGALPLRPIMSVIIESSALYALGVLAALVSFLSGSNGQYAAVDAIIPLVGIVFCLIVIQIRFPFCSVTSIEPPGSCDEPEPMNGDLSPHSSAAEERPLNRVRSTRMMMFHITKQIHPLGRDPSTDVNRVAI
ncbi:hypothetical protein F5148DRAFT_976251 [Russula earlei]|uniref:Uncharacterized protein n=1 Tax=Russula earlei TaxID=71964 RepID=A0ACC0UGK0_9AGAM|nr:hypothetical protein F5148DRAFT_976251 [Russula earlei]